MSILHQCPHCKVKHVQTSDLWKGSFATNRQKQWFIAQCQNPDCGGLILIEIQGESLERIYPPTSLELDPDLNISTEIRSEYEEASRCLSFGCFLSSMTMSRRVLQRCLKSQGCTQHKLAQQIDHAKQKSILPQRYHALADEIREYGNIGAHPDDDQLSNVTRENASVLLGFVEILIEEFYITPARVNKLQQQRQQAK
ncbi:MAG: DUF4145 domain-containing protein [Candidatus Tectomicrobia bacterium]|nr:DUF4145 domain-containing protein [Candidatus Tectomicrobia bacterium]